MRAISGNITALAVTWSSGLSMMMARYRHSSSASMDEDFIEMPAGARPSRPGPHLPAQVRRRFSNRQEWFRKWR
jgi:hypothetical protein